MKKLLLLLAAVGMIFSACEGGEGVEEENGGAPFVPEITISPNDLTFGCNGGEQEVVITANFEYEVAERASWLTVERTDEGLLVVVDANKNTSERSAFISITNSQYDINKSIEIYQEAWVPKIELAQQSVEVEFEPAEYEVGVTSPYSWEATTKNDWIVVESRTGIAGTEKLKFSVLRQEEEKERKGTIVLKNTDYNLIAELYVIQKAFVPSITIEPKALNFAVEGGTQEVAVTANFEEYEASANADWLTVEKSEKGVKITATTHIETTERTADIVISNDKYNISEIINISQDGVPDSKKVILYTSSDEAVVRPHNTSAFGANILSNTYINGQGIIIFDATVTSIGERAFENCSSLTSVTIPDSVTSIGDNAFSSCSSLASVTIGDSVTSIGEHAFENCSSLTSVTIGNSVTSIGKYAFRDCTGLISVTIPNGVTSIGWAAFYKCIRLTSVTIPDSVTSIGLEAFKNCSKLTSVTIGNSVTSIGECAFENCSSLTSVTIPDSVTKIGEDAFYKCSSLTSVTIPDSVTSIGSRAFYGCTGELTVNCNIPSASSSSDGVFFYAKFTKVTIGNSVTKIGSYAFYNCSSLTSVTIGNSVTSIGEQAFYGCTGELTVNCNIPNASYYDYGVFYNAKFTKVTIGNSVTKIGSYAFYECSSLTSVTIGNSVTSIGERAFENCSSLTSVTIPDSVTKIGNYAFCNCSKLKDVYCKPKTPPTGNMSMFANNASGLKIYVPRNSVEAYKSASYWSNYSSNIEGYDF